MTDGKKTKIVKVKNKLKEKAGAGGFKEEDLQRAQNTIDDNDVDFSPIAKELLDKLETTINKVVKQNPYDKTAIGELKFPILQLKAQGSMFNSPVYTELSTDLLSFLEDVQEVDNDIIAIISSFQKAAVVVNKLDIKESSNDTIQKLNVELKSVYQRYLNKKQ